jgi:SAM-dependent methyltransferase
VGSDSSNRLKTSRWTTTVVVLALIFACAPNLPALPAPPALPALPDLPASPGPRQSKSRLFAPVDLGLLEAPDRDQWQKPDQIMDVLNIADGSVVAEIGAAGGWFTIRLARRVGPNGLVYAEDIQATMVDAIERRAQSENLRNVRTVLGGETDPNLPGGIDAVLIADTYREIEDPVTLLRNAAKSLRPQGRIGVVDYNAGGGGPGPAADQRVDPESVIKAAAAAGLQLLVREALPPFQYVLVFGLPTARHSSGMAPDATASFTRSARMNGVKPDAIAPEKPSDGRATSASQPTPPAKITASPASIARNDVP